MAYRILVPRKQGLNSPSAVGSMEFQPLDHQGGPTTYFYFIYFFFCCAGSLLLHGLFNFGEQRRSIIEVHRHITAAATSKGSRTHGLQ